MSLLHLLLQTDFGLYSDYNKDPGQEKKICQTNLSRQYHILDLQYFPLKYNHQDNSINLCRV